MITTAVYSHRSASGRTASDLVDLALWTLSVRNARRHFARLVFITDARGKELLIDGLQLPFDEVRVELDGFEPAYPHIWALGKMQSYALMREPFMHVDHDVICWQPLPRTFLEAGVCTLVAEPMPPLSSRRDYYNPELMAATLPAIPAAIGAHLALLDDNHAYCMGVFGGNDIDWIHEFVACSFAALRDPANAAFWAAANGTWASCQLEQYWLAALARHTGRTVETLARPDDLSDPTQRRFREVGLTHLICGAKRSGYYHDRALARCQEDFPADYDKCQALLKK